LFKNNQKYELFNIGHDRLWDQTRLCVSVDVSGYRREGSDYERGTPHCQLKERGTCLTERSNLLLDVYSAQPKEREGEGEIRSYAGRVLEGEKEREGGRGERK